MKKKFSTCMLLVFLMLSLNAQNKEFTCNNEWVQKIKKLAPKDAEAEATKHHKVLVFSLITGYIHWVTPHTNAVLKVLGDKTGAFDVEISTDIFTFEKNELKKYDAVVLNNNCSVSPRRNLFLDVLDKDKSLTKKQREKKAAELEANLIKFVKKGGGLMVVHGGITMLNNSMAFSNMVGGSFDYHPAQQKITLELTKPNHPLLKAFNGKTFIHTDEPYLFNKAYAKKDFRPLLYMETSKLAKKKPIDENIKYVSWIKGHGKGKVFFVSPTHNAQSFEDTALLKFYLDGAQYILGDLKCDDTPIGIK